MKYGVGAVILLIVCMFGYMYKHNQDKHLELQKEHEARIQTEKQNAIDEEQREKQRAIEKQQKEQALKDMQAQKHDVTTSKPSNHEDKFTEAGWESFCQSISGLGESVMRQRQNGTDMAALINVGEQSDPKLKSVVKAMVIKAYEEPLFTVEEYKIRAIKEFKNSSYLICLQSR